MKKIVLALLIISCLSFLVSCSGEKTEKLGTLEISITDTEFSRGIEPTPIEVSSYSISVTGSSGDVVFSKTVRAEGGSGNCRLQLPVGNYTVKVSALNKEDKRIGEGSSDVEVVVDRTTQCSVAIHEIQGKGTIRFVFSSAEDDALVAKVYDASMSLIDSITLEYAGGMFTGSIELDNGFYYVTVSKADETVLKADTVRVLANQSVKVSDDSEPITITMLYAAAQTEAGSLPDDWAGYQILRDKFGINLQLQMLPSNTNDQDLMVRTMAAADELPDFFVVSRSVWQDLVRQGKLADVTDDFAKMPERSKVMFGPSSKNSTTYNGRVYGFATPSGYAGNEGLLIRKDWLDNLGLAVPTTIDELYDVLYAFTYNDPDGNGKNDTYGYGAFVESYMNYEAYPGRRFEPLMGAFGVEGTWNMSADNFGLKVKDPAYYDWMVFFKRLIDNGVIDPNWQSYKKDDFRAAWKQGKFGVFREQNSAYASKNNYSPFDANFPDGEVIVVDAPVGPTGKKSVGPLVEGFRIFAINANISQEKHDKIIEMFEWMAHGEGYMLCSYGVEGKNYILDEKGLPQADDSLGDLGYNKAIGQRYIQLRNCSFNYNNATERTLRYPGYITATSQKYMSAGDVLKEMQDKTWTPATGMNLMPSPATDVETFYRQGIAEFLNGQRNLTEENWHAFVEQFDSIGGLEWEQDGYEYASENGYLLQ